MSRHLPLELRPPQRLEQKLRDVTPFFPLYTLGATLRHSQLHTVALAKLTSGVFKLSGGSH